MPETLDVGMRADFYEHTGAILDMVVTHLFQLAAEVAMEQPWSVDAEHIAEARAEVIGCFRPLTWDDVVVGQYEGYRAIEGVRPTPGRRRSRPCGCGSTTTDGRVCRSSCGPASAWRSAASGSASFASEPPTGFGEPPEAGNVISFELSGAGEIDLTLVAKRPGPDLAPGAASVRLPLGEAFHTPVLPAYARLIHDVLLGDRPLFTRPDGLAHVWTVAGALLEDKPEPLPYRPGSWGPDAWPAGAPAMLT